LSLTKRVGRNATELDCWGNKQRGR